MNCSVLVGFVLLLLGKHVESDLSQDSLIKIDPCESFCDKTYPPISSVSAKNSFCCRRGCRFFTLVHLVEDKDTADLNATKAACQASCMEAYQHTKERYACNTGCASMAKQKQVETVVSQITWSVYVEDGNDLMMFQPGELDQDELLVDPALRRQVLPPLGVGLMIPEMVVRTLPEEGPHRRPPTQHQRMQQPPDWLQCAALRSGLPRAVLVAAILLPVLLALWLCLAPSRKVNPEELDILAEPRDPFLLKKPVQLV